MGSGLALTPISSSGSALSPARSCSWMAWLQLRLSGHSRIESGVEREDAFGENILKLVKFGPLFIVVHGSGSGQEGKGSKLLAMVN